MVTRSKPRNAHNANKEFISCCIMAVEAFFSPETAGTDSRSISESFPILSAQSNFVSQGLSQRDSNDALFQSEKEV